MTPPQTVPPSQPSSRTFRKDGAKCCFTIEALHNWGALSGLHSLTTGELQLDDTCFMLSPTPTTGHPWQALPASAAASPAQPRVALLSPFAGVGADLITVDHDLDACGHPEALTAAWFVEAGPHLRTALLRKWRTGLATDPTITPREPIANCVWQLVATGDTTVPAESRPKLYSS